MSLLEIQYVNKQIFDKGSLTVLCLKIINTTFQLPIFLVIHKRKKTIKHLTGWSVQFDTIDFRGLGLNS